MTDLENEKYKLEIWIKELSLKGTNTAQLTPEQMKKLFSGFKKFVVEKNLPECKKFIDHYVEKVVVFHDHVELTLKVAVPSGNSHLIINTNKKKPNKFSYLL